MTQPDPASPDPAPTEAEPHAEAPAGGGEVPPPPPEPPPRVQEVEAEPVSGREPQSPVIDTTGERVVPPPPPSGGGDPGTPPRPPRNYSPWSLVCHLMILFAIPTLFLGGVITFLIWQILGKNDPQVEDQGREALNFQINVAILTAILGLTCLAAPLVPIAWLVAVILAIIAGFRAFDGQAYRYPWIWRIVQH